MVRFNSIHSPLTLARPAGLSLRVIVNGNFVTCRSDLEFRFFNAVSVLGFRGLLQRWTTVSHKIPVNMHVALAVLVQVVVITA